MSFLTPGLPAGRFIRGLMKKLGSRCAPAPGKVVRAVHSSPWKIVCTVPNYFVAWKLLDGISRPQMPTLASLLHVKLFPIIQGLMRKI